MNYKAITCGVATTLGMLTSQPALATQTREPNPACEVVYRMADVLHQGIPIDIYQLDPDGFPETNDSVYISTVYREDGRVSQFGTIALIVRFDTVDDLESNIPAFQQSYHNTYHQLRECTNADGGLHFTPYFVSYQADIDKEHTLLRFSMNVFRYGYGD